MTTYQTGDKVKLIGVWWDLPGLGLSVGSVHTVEYVTPDGLIKLGGLNWYASLPGWEVELVTEKSTNILYTKLAGDLTMSDLGEDRMLRWMPLRGKKIVTVSSPIRIGHNIKSRQVTVTREYEYKYGTKLQYSYMRAETKRLRWDIEVEVHEITEIN